METNNKQESVSDEPISGPVSLNFYKDGRFYIHGPIDDSIPQNIIQPLIDEIDKRSELVSPKPIEIFINSPGGDLEYCNEIIGLFKLANARGVGICTFVMAYAASAASMIAVCGNVRYVTRRTRHLLHFARIYEYAHNPEMLQRNLEANKFLQKELVEVYREHTKIKDIEKKLLADNFIITGGKALIRLGLADQII